MTLVCPAPDVEGADGGEQLRKLTAVAHAAQFDDNAGGDQAGVLAEQMGVVPAWAASPRTVSRCPEMDWTPSTMPKVTPASARIGPCSMWHSM